MKNTRKRAGPLRQNKERSDHPVHPQILFTVGHAKRPVTALISLLHEHTIKQLVDIRTIPRSQTNPQHNQSNLENVLPAAGIAYYWLGKELGGLRKLDRSLGELNAGWYNASFRGYADYMQSREFAAGFRELCQIGATQNCAIMCAETYYRRCHRSLVSDALVAHGYEVLHLTSAGKPAVEHKMTHFAKIEEKWSTDSKKVIQITYPAYDEMKDEKARKKDKKSSYRHSAETEREMMDSFSL
jgi:uncharacterized protein (DUF488 family)